METFLYSTLNVAGRTKDQTRIHTLGPFTLALASSVYGAEKSRPEDVESLPKYKREKGFWDGEWIILYRGLKLTTAEIEEYKSLKGKKINLCGFQSTSTVEEKGIEFATGNLQPGKRPVLLKI